jgi:ADP-heptose:LPS heptosyltransferase
MQMSETSKCPKLGESWNKSRADGALPNKWAVFRLSSLGDLVLTSGVLNYWHQTRGWTFTVIARRPYHEIFRNNPAITEVIGLKKEELRFPALLSLFLKLSNQCAGLGLLDLQGGIRARLLAGLWKGPVARYKKFALQRRIFLRTRRREYSSALCEYNIAQRYALALEASAPEKNCLLPKVYLSGEETEQAKSRLAGIFAQDSPLPVVLHPFATHALKAWPREHWLVLVKKLVEAGRPWLILGQGEALFPDDERDLTGRTSLRELCALLSRSLVLVTGDSGPMHLATAVGTPVLALFGPTTREWGFYPQGEKDRVLELELACRPCSLHGAGPCRDHGRCLREITPERVFTALQEFLV